MATTTATPVLTIARHLLGAAVVAAALAAGASGCARAKPMFAAPDKPIVWPAPPEPPRLRYVGQLHSSADLKAPVSMGKRLSNAVFGKKPEQAMLSPYAVCTDGRPDGRVFVADSNAQVVHVFNLANRRYTTWRPKTKSKRFAQPVGVAYDPTKRRLFVADSVAGAVYVFNDAGTPIGTIGTDVVKRPCGLAFDAGTGAGGHGGRLLVADAGLHQVLAFSPAGTLLQQAGKRGVAPGEFNFPTNVAVDRAGRVFVADSLNFRVQQLDAGLRPVRVIGEKGDMPGYFSQPKGLALDSQGHLYVVDAQFESVQVFDAAAGALLLDVGQEGRGPGEFWLPAGIFIDPADRVWVADTYNRRVQVFDYVPGPPAPPVAAPSTRPATRPFTPGVLVMPPPRTPATREVQP